MNSIANQTNNSLWAYYLCFAAGGAMYTLPESIGRKRSVMLSAFLSLVAQTTIICCKQLFVRTLCFALMGLSQIKNSVSYVWLAECVPMAQRSSAYTYINIFDAVPMAVFCLYVSFIQKDWLYINMIATALSYIAFVMAFFCPESPRWYLVNGRRDEAIETLNYMARVNNSPHQIPKSAQFVEDPTIFAQLENPSLKQKQSSQEPQKPPESAHKMRGRLMSDNLDLGFEPLSLSPTTPLNNVSDMTAIKGVQWKDLKAKAMDPSFQDQNWFKSLNKQEQSVVDLHVRAQRSQGNMLPLSNIRSNERGTTTDQTIKNKPKFLLKLQATQEFESPKYSPKNQKEGLVQGQIETKQFKRAHKWDMQPSMSMLSESDDYMSVKEGQNPKLTLLLLMILAIGQMVQYCVLALYCAKIPGNKFYNGILFGVGELSAMFFSGYLMKKYTDMKAFYINMAILVVSELVLILFPYQGLHTYISVFLLVGMLGGWINILLLVIELRVPPTNVGSVTMICMTIAVGCGASAPTISFLPKPLPIMVCLAITGISFITSIFLPEPGLYLPKNEKNAPLAEKRSDAVSLLQVMSIHNHLSPNYYGQHQMSYQETASERAYNIQRPQLNTTMQDPDFVFQLSDAGAFSTHDLTYGGVSFNSKLILSFTQNRPVDNTHKWVNNNSVQDEEE